VVGGHFLGVRRPHLPGGACEAFHAPVHEQDIETIGVTQTDPATLRKSFFIFMFSFITKISMVRVKSLVSCKSGSGSTAPLIQAASETGVSLCGGGGCPNS